MQANAPAASSVDPGIVQVCTTTPPNPPSLPPPLRLRRREREEGEVAEPHGDGKERSRSRSHGRHHRDERERRRSRSRSRSRSRDRRLVGRHGGVGRVAAGSFRAGRLHVHPVWRHRSCSRSLLLPVPCRRDYERRDERRDRWGGQQRLPGLQCNSCMLWRHGSTAGSRVLTHAWCVPSCSLPLCAGMGGTGRTAATTAATRTATTGGAAAAPTTRHRIATTGGADQGADRRLQAAAPPHKAGVSRCLLTP